MWQELPIHVWSGNYTGVLVGIAFILFGGWCILSAKKWFKGPVVQGNEAELEEIERGYETPGRPGVTTPAS